MGNPSSGSIGTQDSNGFLEKREKVDLYLASTGVHAVRCPNPLPSMVLRFKRLEVMR
jgi:hypothetical protein